MVASNHMESKALEGARKLKMPEKKHALALASTKKKETKHKNKQQQKLYISELETRIDSAKPYDGL